MVNDGQSIDKHEQTRMAECHLRPVIHILQRAGCIPKPIPSFACYGTCNSYVQVSDSKFWRLERSCNCCQEIGEREASVMLHCPGQTPQYRRVTTRAPVECLCRPCSAVDEQQVKPLEMFLHNHQFNSNLPSALNPCEVAIILMMIQDSRKASFNTRNWSKIVNDENNVSQTLNDSIVIDQVFSSVSMSLSSSTPAAPAMNNGNNNDRQDVDRPSSSLWTTRILTNNNDTVSIQCSQLFTNSAADLAVNDTSIMVNVTNIANITTNTGGASFKFGQLSQQLSNQSQLLFNETWLFSNLAANVHEDGINATSSANSIVMSENSSSFYCDTVWDGFYCWPMTASGTILMHSCRDIFDSVGELPKDQIDESTYNNGQSEICGSELSSQEIFIMIVDMMFDNACNLMMILPGEEMVSLE
ncbi:bursicon-like protein [Dermatophagoides farinae]|uniref:Bursicon n=2 Tax=Dermatophagoides farinae TaxID=6954 RepID=A0A9D4P8G6_DERFA|nr:bursicon-like protein [Dermatophagoides farinae]